MKLLLAADLHIGRSSTKVPDRVNGHECRASAAWTRLVDLAIEEGVRVVCLAGDVVDQDNRFWEALGPLDEGLRRLAREGIRTVAVAGNHDFEVLPRLARQLPPDQFILLGRGGRWERHAVEQAGRNVLWIDGWSFPRERVESSPLATYGLDRDRDLPILSMVHGDLDVQKTRYAPLELARLQALPPGGWLLGHVHAPRRIEGPPWVLYPGSPQALDPGEPGPHGVWLLEVRGGSLGLPEQRALSSVWYGEATLDVSGIEEEESLRDAVVARLREEARSIRDGGGPHLVHASLRLRVEGSTPISHLVRKAVESLAEDEDDVSLSLEDISLSIEKIDVATLPAVDLEECAKSHSALGAVARLLVQLERSEVSPEVDELIRETAHKLKDVERQRGFAQIEPREVSDDMVREHLRVQGRALLTELFAQSK